MSQIATIMPEPQQRMRALERANEVRLARARLKRQIASGQISAAYVLIEAPSEVENWSVGELLMSQRRWGTTRVRKLLAGQHISEKRPIGDLTERQRRLLAAQITAHAPGLFPGEPCFTQSDAPEFTQPEPRALELAVV